jgi:hypothetical protein
MLGKLDMLRVTCDKCGRAGWYHIETVAVSVGLDGKLTEWLYELTPRLPAQAITGATHAARGARTC